MEINEGSLSAEQYAKLFAAYFFTDELCASKFLWRRVPESIKTNSDLQRVWLIGKSLWTKQYRQAYELIDCKWSKELEPIMAALKCRIQHDILKFISLHYENIKFDQFQLLMGVDKDQAIRIVESEGWSFKNDYVIPVAIHEPELFFNGSQEILDRLVTLSSFTTYIEN